MPAVLAEHRHDLGAGGVEIHAPLDVVIDVGQQARDVTLPERGIGPLHDCHEVRRCGGRHRRIVLQVGSAGN